MKWILALALVPLSAPMLAAQDPPGASVDSAPVSRVALYRDPHRARILGTIIPGAGQFYAGEYLRGYMTLVATGGGLAMGPIIFSMDSCSFAFLSDCKPGPKWPYEVAGASMVVASVWSWFSTARDAPHAAERANLRHGAETAALTPFIQPSPALPGQWNAGVKIRW